MRQYTWDKHLESWVKNSGILGGAKNSTPTVISPIQYKKRFRKAMTTYFLMVPDQWSPPSMSQSKSQSDFGEETLHSQGRTSVEWCCKSLIVHSCVLFSGLNLPPDGFLFSFIYILFFSPLFHIPILWYSSLIYLFFRRFRRRLLKPRKFCQRYESRMTSPRNPCRKKRNLFMYLALQHVYVVYLCLVYL